MDRRPIILFVFFFGFCMVSATHMYALEAFSPSTSTMNAPEMKLVVSNEALLEEGKALYENQQYIAALGKFMTVLRKDPQQPEARHYLRLVVDVMRQNPAAVSGTSSPGGRGDLASPAVQEELRNLMRQRSLFTLDLKAIPGVHVDYQKGTARVDIDTSLLFADKSGGLREEGVPVLDRVAAWLKTFGQQPVIIHIYPEELQDPAVNGSLFLNRYSELYNFFVEERKMTPQRFVSADLLVEQTVQTAVDQDNTLNSSTSTPHVAIETLGSQSELLEAMPAAAPRHAMSRWLELSIMSSKSVFDPEEGEWASLDIAALTRTGLRDWSFLIAPSDKPTKAVMSLAGNGNLLKRVSWDGHDQKTGSFVPAGSYLVSLKATDSDGTMMSREITLQVQSSATDETILVSKIREPEKPVTHAKHKKKPKAVPSVASAAPSAVGTTKPVAAPATTVAAAPAQSVPTPAAAPSSDDSDSLIDSKPPQQAPSPAGTEDAAAQAAPADTEDSVHAIWKQVIQFEPDQSDLQPTLKASLERIGKTLEVYPLQKVRIVGFAVISEQNAAALAKKRAENVRSILVDEYHVDRKRVIDAGGKVVSSDGASKVEMSITN